MRCRKKFSESEKQYQKFNVKENFLSGKTCGFENSGVRNNYQVRKTILKIGCQRKFSKLEKQYQKRGDLQVG